MKLECSSSRKKKSFKAKSSNSSRNSRSSRHSTNRLIQPNPYFSSMLLNSVSSSPNPIANSKLDPTLYYQTHDSHGYKVHVAGDYLHKNYAHHHYHKIPQGSDISSIYQQQQPFRRHLIDGSKKKKISSIDGRGEYVGKSIKRRRGDRTAWEYHTISVTRVPGYGFGIAVSGGRDNPHFANGDPSIAVSDVLKGGPAEDRLQVNDRIISVNGVSLENVEYATAVQVLRDSGNTVTLVVKRRSSTPNPSAIHQHSHNINSVGLINRGNLNNPGVGVQLPIQQAIPTTTTTTTAAITTSSPQPIKVVLTKSSKKEDFGVVLGCRLFIKEISTKARDQLTANGYSLQEGDIITRIHNTNCNDTMNMKEAKKIIDSCKERLNLVVLRDITNQSVPANNSNNLNNSNVHSPLYSSNQQMSGCSGNLDDSYLGGANYSSQNLYVQPPTRAAAAAASASSAILGEEKNNLTPRGRSRGPITDVSLSQLDRPNTPTNNMSSKRPDEPPRPPPPRGEDFYTSRRQLYEDDPLQRSKQSAEPRFISFQKEGSVGIRLTGGNEAGIFVTAVQPGSPASLQGLTPGDKILKVNDMDMHGVTREEAVLFLLSLQDRIDLIVQHCKEEYEEVVANQRGDSFHIKTHFHCENPSKGEMAFKAGDVFRVTDTLHNGVVGSWQVLKIGRGHQEMQRGVIPNKSRAEELATAQFNATKKEMNASESRGNFFRRRRSTHRRSKSLSRENWDDVVFSDSISKFPAYERVVLRHPGFVRPVVLFGPVADLARDKLTKDFPDKFTAPLQDDDKSNSKCKIVRLSNIRDIMDRGKHALLDITPNAVDRLNYAQFYPIVIFLKTDSKHVIKQLRQGIPKSAHKSSKKLLEQCQKLERVWSHIFSTTIILNDTESWYRKLREAIDLQQSGAVWMSESKPVESLSDDFLFPMTTSRLSYASSPESDLELSPGPSASLSLGNLPQLVKSSSDPSIATNQDNLDRDREIGDGLPPPYTHPYEHSNTRRPTIDNKYNYPPTQTQTNTMDISTARPQSIYGINAPDLPPRIDRGSKPPGGRPLSSPVMTSPARNNNSCGTMGRSAQERLLSKQSGGGAGAEELQDEYVTRNNIESVVESIPSSLDRQRANVINSPSKGSSFSNTQNGSYDSVSSYDSYNTTQLSVQNIRLGPNAPDDLKSVPTANGRPPPPVVGGPNAPQDYRGSGIHEHHVRGLSAPNELNRQNSPGRPSYHDLNSARGMESGNLSNSGLNIPQRPSNLVIGNSPRKQVVETKTDYGKYSRNNSASQADYSKIPKSPHVASGPPSGPANNTNNNNGAPFKPVPPPKPKNYRPPMQGQMNWESGEPSSPKSPNGFFYPPTPSHYHHTQATPGSPHNNNNNNPVGPPPSAAHGFNHFNANQQQPPYIPPNNYNGGNHHYGGPPYMHRGPPPAIGNLPIHTSERHSLDLAGSREQRGSAFELYRKPQIGTAGHHHNMSSMEPSGRYCCPSPHYQTMTYVDDYQQSHHHHHHHHEYNILNSRNSPSSTPLPQIKNKKKSLLKSPLIALKNAFIKSTRPLRRMNSMVEPEPKLKPCLKRQHSMIERSNLRESGYYLKEYPMSSSLPPIHHHHHHQQQQEQEQEQQQFHNLRHEPFYPQYPHNSYHHNFDETENIYNSPQNKHYTETYENLYVNRALIDLERYQTESQINGRRIIRRHSMADRTNAGHNVMYSQSRNREDEIYKSCQGSYLMEPKRTPQSVIMIRRKFQHDYKDEPIYQSRKEMHRNHLYQSRREMQDRIAQGKREIRHEFDRENCDQQLTGSGEDKSSNTHENDLNYQSKREIKESGFQIKMQLEEKIYQSRRDAMESMAEPVYVSKRDVVKHEPIYETQEENVITKVEEEEEEDDDAGGGGSGSGGDDKKEENLQNTFERISNNSKQSDLQESNETVIENIENTVIDVKQQKQQQRTDSEKLESVLPKKDPNDDDDDDDDDSIPITPRSLRTQFHISNVIKRTAPPPVSHSGGATAGAAALNLSRTSIETQYTQTNISVGPPNASSTPYASDISLALNCPPHSPQSPGGAAEIFPGISTLSTVALREPSTTKGIFDESGGVLCDKTWNVSLHIPPGALPSGSKQEIYFTVSDPRMSETLGGPPLDMENGETMLSPLVMCGPQGLEFLVPVTLNIPHCAGQTTSLGLTLKATDSEKNLQTNWDNIDLPSNTAAHTVSVKVDHF